MIDKQVMALVGLTAVIVIFTGAVIGGHASSTLDLGVVAPMIFPALLTLWLLMIVAYGRRIIEMLAAALFPPRLPQERRTASLITIILAWMLAIVLAAIIVRPEVVSFIANALQQTAQVLSSAMGVFSQSNQPPITPIPSGSNTLLFYYTILVFGAIILVSFSLILGALRSAYLERRALTDNSELKKGTLDIIQDAMAKLESRQKYNEIILECYRQMCETLSGKGHLSIQPAQTPREFADGVSGQLDLDAESVKGLTFLFEEARYSKHTIGDDKRGLALNYLRSLEHALIGVGAKP